jgi:small-conductance mechanosensitive channel
MVGRPYNAGMAPVERPASADPTLEEIRPSQDISEGLDKLEDLGSDFISALPLIAVAAVVFVLFLLLGKLIRWMVRRFTRSHRKHRNFALAVGRVVQGTMVVIGLLVAAVIVFPGFTPTRLLSFLGLSSVAIGFAFRDVLQNYLAGILLLLTEPFRIGDQIVFGTYEGTVEDIQTRATTIRTYDGRRVVIPNAELFTNSVIVNTAFENRRIEYDLGIGYGDDIAEAREVIMGVLKAEPSAVSDPPPDVLVYELGREAVVLRVRWWIEPPQRKENLYSRDAVLEKVKSALQSAGIDMPLPTQQVLFHDQTEEFDGDRRNQREGWPARRDDPPDTRAEYRKRGKSAAVRR